MTASGTYNLTLTRNELASEVYELLQVAADGETLSGDLVNKFQKSANLLLKSWQTNGFMPWLETEGTLFLEVGKNTYDFSTAKISNNWYETTTTADTSAGDYVIPVTSASNIQQGDTIGVIQTDSDLFWTTVTFINSLNITVADAITKTTTSGAKVRNYRDTFKPVSRVTDVRRETSNNEIEVKLISREEFNQLPNKTTQGVPVIAYYDRQNIVGSDDGEMKVCNTPSSSDPVLNFTYERKLQIFTGTSDTIDLPEYAQMAFVFNCAKSLALKIGVSPERYAIIAAEADRLFNDMLAYNADSYPIKMELGYG